MNIWKLSSIKVPSALHQSTVYWFIGRMTCCIHSCHQVILKFTVPHEFIFLSRDNNVLKLMFSIFWVMMVSFSRYWATVYVIVGLFGLWWDYIGSSKMILYTFVTLHIAICDFKFFKILKILLKLVIIHTWCSFWGLLNSMYLYVTMNIPSKDISKWLSQVLMLWSAFKQF